jgi:hypothetical protein
MPKKSFFSENFKASGFKKMRSKANILEILWGLKKQDSQNFFIF